MSDAETIHSFVQLALGDDLKGGSIQVKRDVDGKGLFATRLPIAGRRVAAVEAEMVGAIDLDWRASGKKEQRSYTLLVIAANRDIESQRCISREPDPVTPQDIVSQGAAVTLVTLNDAAATIKQPFDQLKDLVTLQRTEIVGPQREMIDYLKGEVETWRTRAKELEREVAAKTDELREHKGKHAEAELLDAQATKARKEGEAALVVATAEAQAIGKLTDTGVAAFPKLLGVAAKVIGGGGLGKLVDGALGGGAPAAPVVGPAPGAAPAAALTDAQKRVAAALAAEPFPAELEAKIRALPLKGVELARLLKFFWMLDPEGDALDLLTEPTREVFFPLLPAAHAHFTKKAP